MADDTIPAMEIVLREIETKSLLRNAETKLRNRISRLGRFFNCSTMAFDELERSD
jgi:hypothetical protein